MIKYFEVTFFDKKCIEVTEDQANKIKSAIAKGVRHFEMNGNLYFTKGIARIEFVRKEYSQEEIDRCNDPFGEVKYLTEKVEDNKTPEQIEAGKKKRVEFIQKQKEEIYKKFGWQMK